MSKQSRDSFSGAALQIGVLGLLLAFGLIIYKSNNHRKRSRFKGKKTSNGNLVISVKNDKIEGFRFLVSFDDRTHCQFIDLDKNSKPSSKDYCLCFERNRNPYANVTNRFSFICGTHYPNSIDDGNPIRALPFDNHRLKLIKGKYLSSLPKQSTKQIKKCLPICKNLFK